MPTRLPKSASDIKIWGVLLNDAVRSLMLISKLNIVANGNNPPTVMAGTMFGVFKTDSYLTPLTPPTGNNVYPVNTTITYPVSESIFELTNRTFGWSSGGFPAIANSTVYYLHCTGGEDVDATSQGKGVYGASTVKPTFDDTKQGWYNVSGKVLCRFFVDSGGNVLPGSICHYTSQLVAELYTTTTGAPSITGLDCIKDGCVWYVSLFLKLNISGQNVLQYINGDTTAANYLGENDRYSQVLASTSQPLLLQGITINGEIIGRETIEFLGGRSSSTGKLSGGVANNSISFHVREAPATALRTNITQLSWAISGGAWVAGSDIRIYRR